MLYIFSQMYEKKVIIKIEYFKTRNLIKFLKILTHRKKKLQYKRNF